MTLVILGPVTHDLVAIGDDETQKVGGATYFQSFVFERFYDDYMAIVNCRDEAFADEFPDPGKVHVIRKSDTHYFINHYPDKNNRNIRHQSSNFAEIPILKSDLEDILPENIDGFVINPLNRHDFPAETVEYLKSFNVPIFLSLQGFLRVPDIQADENYTIKLSYFDELDGILSGVSVIFMDEGEADIIGTDHDVDEMVITDGSHGSRILCGEEIKIRAVKCEEVVDTTGCGDTYMAAYIAWKLHLKSPETCANFASEVASQKIGYFGPYGLNE